MLLSLLVATVCSFQSKGYFEMLFPAPTGLNGYEDYVRAGDLLRDPLFVTYVSWTPQQTEQLETGSVQGTSAVEQARRQLVQDLRGSDYIAVYRRMQQRYGKALELVRIGNAKPVMDPRTRFTADTLFPELAGFKNIAKLAQADAHAKFASGDSAGAVRTLLDTMTFARRVDNPTLIQNLVSIAMIAIVNAAFEENLGALTLADATTIAQYVDRALAESPKVQAVLECERQFALNAVSDAMSSEPAEDDEDDSEAQTSLDLLPRLMKRWSPSEKASFRNSYDRTIRERWLRANAVFAQPESRWTGLLGKLDDEEKPPSGGMTPEDIGVAMGMEILPLYKGWGTSLLRSRAQMRLLGLHARVVAFRWKMRRLPEKLTEAVPETMAHDPMTGESFVYEPGDKGSYRLYSKGSSETGPISLKYQRPSGSTGPDDDLAQP